MALILPIKVPPTLGSSFSLFLNIYVCSAGLPSLIPLGARNKDHGHHWLGVALMTVDQLPSILSLA